jgi:capsular exopolysaccharide synthesis family protein
MSAVEPLTLSEQSDLRGFLSLLRRQIVPIVVCAIVTASATFAFAFTQPKTYRATTQILYTDPGSIAGLASGDPARAVDTLVQLATTDDVLKSVTISGQNTSAGAIRAATDVTGDANANIITVAAEAGTPRGAAALANAVAASLVTWRNENRSKQIKSRLTFLQEQLGALAGRSSPSEVAIASDLRAQIAEASAQLQVPNPELTLVSPATPPSSPISPRPFLNAIVGFLAGLMLGLLIGAFRDRLDRRLHTLEEIEAAYPWPVVGTVPAVDTTSGRRPTPVDFSRMSVIADAYRSIRTNLTLMTLGHSESKVWVISSAMPAEGKSAAVANLASALASSGLRVLAISADLHSPALHEYFAPAGSEPRAGLIEVLAREVRLEDAAQVAHVPLGSVDRHGYVDLLAGPGVFPDPAVLFQSGAMLDLLSNARKRYDAIVIDAPPLLFTAEALILARLADELVLVARLNHLTRNQATRAVKLVETMQLRPVGVIATGIQATEELYGYRDRTGGESDGPRSAQPTARGA